MRFTSVLLVCSALSVAGCHLGDVFVPLRAASVTAATPGCTRPEPVAPDVFQARGALGAGVSLRFVEDVDASAPPQVRVTGLSITSDSVAARSALAQVLREGYRPVPLDSLVALPDGSLHLTSRFGPPQTLQSLRENGFNVELSWREPSAPQPCVARFQFVSAE